MTRKILQRFAVLLGAYAAANVGMLLVNYLYMTAGLVSPPADLSPFEAAWDFSVIVARATAYGTAIIFLFSAGRIVLRSRKEAA